MTSIFGHLLITSTRLRALRSGTARRWSSFPGRRAAGAVPYGRSAEGVRRAALAWIGSASDAGLDLARPFGVADRRLPTSTSAFKAPSPPPQATPPRPPTHPPPEPGP